MGRIEWMGTILMVQAVACGAAKPPAPMPAPEVVSASPVPQAPQGSTDRILTRAAVHTAISQGLGAFLQHVEFDEQPVRVGGKFHGFRIAALHEASFWKGVDLKPGDVVTRLNGMPIERPEQAQAAFEALDQASELRVSYEREGAQRQLVIPIVEDH